MCAKWWRSWPNSWRRMGAASRRSRGSATPRTGPSGACPAAGLWIQQTPLTACLCACIFRRCACMHLACCAAHVGFACWEHARSMQRSCRHAGLLAPVEHALVVTPCCCRFLHHKESLEYKYYDLKLHEAEAQKAPSAVFPQAAPAAAAPLLPPLPSSSYAAAPVQQPPAAQPKYAVQPRANRFREGPSGGASRWDSGGAGSGPGPRLTSCVAHPTC